MPTKFYFHDASASVAYSSEQSSQVNTQTVPGSPTPRVMDTTIGTGQVSVSYNTLGNTNAQPTWIRSFASAPLTAQTITSGTWTLQLAASVGNTNSNFQPTCNVFVWRPSTVSVVGTRIMDFTVLASPAAGTAETSVSGSVSSSVTVATQAGDVLICEVWRSLNVQGMGTAYANTIYYDGTVEGSTTDNAAYLLAPGTITTQSGGGTVTSPVTMAGSGTLSVTTALTRVAVVAMAGSGTLAAVLPSAPAAGYVLRRGANYRR